MADNQIHILLWQDPSGTSIEWLMKKQLNTTRLVKRLMEWVRNNELREWQENERTQTARSTPSRDCKVWLGTPRASGLTLSLSKSQGRSFQYYIGLISAEPTFDFFLYKNWILGQQIRTSATKPEDLSWVPRTHNGGGREPAPISCLLNPWCVHHGRCSH